MTLLETKYQQLTGEFPPTKGPASVRSYRCILPQDPVSDEVFNKMQDQLPNKLISVRKKIL